MLKFKCLVSKYGHLTKDKIYTCIEKSTLFDDVYFVKGDNGAITSIHKDDPDFVFIDQLRIQKIGEILKSEDNE
jgi:hypothetical protein